MKKQRLYYTTTLFNEIYLNAHTENKEPYFLKAEKIPFGLAQTLLGSALILLLFPVLYFFYIVFQGARFFIEVFKTDSQELKCGEYFLATAYFASSINERINKYAPRTIWLLNSTIKKADFVIQSDYAISIKQVLKPKDILNSFWDSFLTPFIIWKKFGHYYLLVSLNSFNWYTYFYAASKIPFDSELFFLDHKDRWALLEDKVLVRKKSLIQHGKEAAVTPKNRVVVADGVYCHDMPYKFKTIDTVYCFSEKEYIALTHSIISNTPQKVIIGFDFKTTPVETSAFSVLIIGNQELFANVEEQIIAGLQDKEVVLYVKGHPTQSNVFYQQLLTKYYFHLIKGSEFPMVNMVVSYSSTLALEYESVGVEVLYHTVLSLDKIINIIESRRNEYTAGKGH